MLSLLPGTRHTFACNKGALIQPARTFLFGFLSLFQKKLIYPPNPNQITTRNRLFPTYIESPTELGTLVLTKEPLLLNFTFPGDPKCNQLTQALFDILSDSSRYPLPVDKPVALANIACDGPGGKDLQQQYVVNKIPTVVLLKKQMLEDRFVPSQNGPVSDQLALWIKNIY